jgi:glycine dehydrogenase subunit 2
MAYYDKLIFELDNPGACGVDLEPLTDAPLRTGLPAREGIGLPHLSEPDVVRHLVRRSAQNYNIDANFYPLGSCTMKHNPRVNEAIARYAGFAHLHPLQPTSTAQGALRVIYELQQILATLTGFPAVSLQTAAGAHSELVSLMMIRACHESKGERRTVVLIPDSAHGTNPASAAACGYKTVTVPSDASGTVDVAALRKLVNKDVAALMITNPNTCGIFERNIVEISEIMHSVGAMVYCDGANFNAIVGRALPAKMGVDVMHINLHKTFTTPHGGGGPGGGVVCSTAELAPFMPIPMIEKVGDKYVAREDCPQSVGRIKGFNGHFGVVVRALCYILSVGSSLTEVSGYAVLNANYILACLKDLYDAPFGDRCMHECLLSDSKQITREVTTNDIAKYLIDNGIHPMTVYFPLVVKGSMLIEPTETENKVTLDHFISVMRHVAQSVAKGDIAFKAGLPKTTPVRKVDETLAARRPKLRYAKA